MKRLSIMAILLVVNASSGFAPVDAQLALETSGGRLSAFERTGDFNDLRLRLDIDQMATRLPMLLGNHRNPYTFAGDLVLLNSLLFGLQYASNVMGFEHAHKLPWDASAPMLAFGGVDDNTFSWTWKDSNFGSATFNVVGHPLSFFAMSSYFRDVRGYGQATSFLGGMVMNMLWETMWENVERPVSLHDLMMNTLGALVGSHDSMGLAFGVNPFSPVDTAQYYTEFYGQVSASTRAWLRYYPVENYSDEPLIPWDLGLGATYRTDTAEVSASATLLTSAQLDRWSPTPQFEVAARLSI